MLTFLGLLGDLLMMFVLLNGVTLKATYAATVSSPTLTLSASSGSSPLSTPSPRILRGESANLTWTATHAIDCVASGGWFGAKGTEGRERVQPTATTTYTLTCNGSGGKVEQSVTVTVLPRLHQKMTPLPKVSR